jgi:hypothetical protein
MLIDGILQQAAVIAVGVPLYENVLPRDYTVPAVVLHQYGNTQDYAMGGPTDNTEDQVQLDVYAADATGCRTLAKSLEAGFKSFIGTLPDGTTVLGCFIERSMAMPFKASGDVTGILHRWTLGFRFVSRG